MSFISEIETVVEEVADWGADLVERAVNALAPDGRPFGYVELDDQEQILAYMDMRGNPEAWAKYIGDLAGQLMMKLQEAAVPPDEIKAIHPIDIAIKFAIQYSYDMEALIARKADGIFTGS